MQNNLFRIHLPNNKYYPTFVRHIFVYIDSHILSLATSFLAHFLINMDRWLLDKWMQRKGAEESLLIIVKTNVIVRDRERERCNNVEEKMIGEREN